MGKINIENSTIGHMKDNIILSNESRYDEMTEKLQKMGIKLSPEEYQRYLGNLSSAYYGYILSTQESFEFKSPIHKLILQLFFPNLYKSLLEWETIREWVTENPVDCTYDEWLEK
jgi:hypothetical protein